MNFRTILALGIALFAIFFGAGNVVFPLDLGRQLGDKYIWGIIGILISGVIMPLVGVFGAALYDGNYREFFRRIGVIPGEILSLIIILLVGPFGAIPRTITVAHAAISWYFPAVSLFIFSIVTGVLVLLAALNQEKVIDVLGKFLGPIKVVLILSVIVCGFFIAPVIMPTNWTPLDAIWQGLGMGTYTLDLLAAMLITKLVLMGIDRSEIKTQRDLIIGLTKAGFIAAFLLGLVYVGFMIVGAFHGAQVPAVPTQQLIFAIADFVMGRFGFLSSLTVATACLVTAIALTSIFADYITNLAQELFHERISYKQAVFGSIIITVIFANLGFGGIMRYIGPIAVICYPALIVLVACNIAYKLFRFKLVKLPFYVTLLISALMTWYF
ncbi:MAG TPA: branched-chain amino acid transport system II carrier protein [Candidatus Babeliales bacterium]|nr:branched-chain amino acid transport system II carrier protein [Candidatus Babeliales bacterium]